MAVQLNCSQEDVQAPTFVVDKPKSTKSKVMSHRSLYNGLQAERGTIRQQMLSVSAQP